MSLSNSHPDKIHEQIPISTIEERLQNMREATVEKVFGASNGEEVLTKIRKRIACIEKEQEW